MAYTTFRSFFSLLLCLLVPALLVAKPAPLPASKCIATAALVTRNYPGSEAIPSVNALTLPAGKAVEAEGQRIIITGHVLDSACVPVADAQVELWQNDPYGRWILANESDLVSARPAFSGAGRAITDNNGEFHFITLFPAAVGGLAPNFNIRIRADGLNDFSTILYFAGDKRNKADKLFSKLSLPAQQSISIRMNQQEDGQLYGNIELALPGKIPYRGF